MKLLYVPVAICVLLFVCLQTARTNPLRTTRDVTEAETHQGGDVEVMELHLCE